MKDTEKGFVSIIIILAIVGLLAAGSYAVVVQQSTVSPRNSDTAITPIITPTSTLKQTTQVTTSVSSGIKGKVLLYESSGVECASAQDCDNLSPIGPGAGLTLSVIPSLDGTKNALDRDRALLLKAGAGGEFQASLAPNLYYISDGSEVDGKIFQESRIKGQWVEVGANQIVTIEAIAIQPGV